jgi:hypothetical protein
MIGLLGSQDAATPEAGKRVVKVIYYNVCSFSCTREENEPKEGALCHA